MSDGLELRDLREDADGGWNATVRVAPDSPWFAGHFPGEPVLPAMAQIGLVARLHAETAGPGSPTALPNLRLAGPVLPGDVVTVHLDRTDPTGRAVFRLEKQDDKVSSGTMAWGDEPQPSRSPEEPGDARRHEGRGPHRHLPSPELLPHTPPSRLATGVLEIGDGHVLCRGSIPAANASARGGEAGPWMALELAAQAAGLLQAAGEGDDVEPRVGYIVRIRDARFSRPTLPAETTLLARVDHDGGGGPLSLYRARVELDGAVVCTATLGTYVPPR